MGYENKMINAGYLNGFSRETACPVCGKKFMTYHKSTHVVCSEKCADIEIAEAINEMNAMGL